MATSHPFCLSKAVVGAGVLSASGLASRGTSAKDYTTPKIRSAGGGATLWEFRAAILKEQPQQTTTDDGTWNATLPGGRNRVIWAVADEGTEADSWASRLLRGLRQGTSNLVSEAPKRKDVPSRIRRAVGSHAWIAKASQDHQVWPALFLPRGSDLILLYDPNEFPRTGPRPSKKNLGGDHPVFANFQLWNHASHLQIHWLAIPQTEEEEQRLTRILEGILLSPLASSKARKDLASSLDTAVEDSIATFQRHPLRLVRREPLPSHVHCIGNNWEWDAANFRSCLVENLCFDIRTKAFVLGPPPHSLPPLGAYDWTSTSRSEHDHSVMMGHSIRIGSGQPWFPEGSEAVQERVKTFYALPDHLVWLPYFAEVPNANNPGHLLWDYFLPLYTLLEIFGLTLNTPVQSSPLPVPLLMNLDDQCVPQSTTEACYNLTRKFLPLLGVNPSTLASARQSRVTMSGNEPNPRGETSWVCASKGLIGIGMLTDHGFKKHGQLLEDYRNVWNAGRGDAFWRFRNFMVSNMLGSKLAMEVKSSSLGPPYTITFSINSSENPSRRRDFASHIQALQSKLPASMLQVETVELGKLSMEEQIRIMERSSVFVSVAGGSASTAMFLRRNAVLILFFNDLDDFVKDDQKKFVKTNMPSMLDWDFWNNASYLRVHWLPISSMETNQDLSLFTALIRQEVESFSLFLD